MVAKEKLYGLCFVIVCYALYCRPYTGRALAYKTRATNKLWVLK